MPTFTDTAVEGQLRSRRAILTFVSGEAFTAVTVVVGLVATPLLLRWLGDERFGAFEAASDWFGYVGLLELGIGGALLPLLARAVALRDRNGVRKILAAGLKAYARVTFLMVAAAIALAGVITWLVPVGRGNAGDLRLGCLIGAIGLMTVPLSAFRALTEAEQKGYWIRILLIGQSLIITGAALLLAWLGLGIRGQFVALVVGAIFYNCVLGWRGVRSLPGVIRAAMTEPREPKVWRQLSELNWPTLTWGICGQVSVCSDNIIIGRLLSPAAVVPFFVTQRLATLAQRELQGIGNASWAGLAELHARQQSELFNRRLVELTRIVAILAVAVLVPIATYNHRFVALWVGAERWGGAWLTIIVTLNAFLRALFTLWGACINGTGKIRAMLPALIAESIINLSLSIILTITMGLVGPVLGSALGFVTVRSWYVPRLLKRLFGTSLGELANAVIWPAASALPYGLTVHWFANVSGTSGWISIAAQMAAAALCYLSLWWLLAFRRSERLLWLDRFRAAFGQRPATLS